MANETAPNAPFITPANQDGEQEMSGKDNTASNIVRQENFAERILQAVEFCEFMMHKYHYAEFRRYQEGKRK